MSELLGAKDIDRAIAILERGGTVIFPTETVYGLGARIDDPAAVQKIFTAKGRPQDNPLIVHIGKFSQVEDLAFDIPEIAWTLIERFWPGPLTLGLKKKPWVSDQITAGLPTVGIRMPSHPVAQAILASGLFIAAPSANPSGSPSPTREEHVQEMIGKVDAIVMAGDTDVGLESTFLDLSGERPRILRPGKVSFEDLVVYLPDLENVVDHTRSASPGTRYRHYAPKTPVYLVRGSTEQYAQFMQAHPEAGFFVPDELWTGAANQVRFYPEGNLETASYTLYAALRALDQQYSAIYIPLPKPEGIGRALLDRLTRAAQGNIIDLEAEHETISRE